MKGDPHDGLRGKWRSFLISEGFDEKYLTGKQVGCPTCGGKDRFRFDDLEEGRWFCNHCGAGDGFTLLARARKVSFLDALKLARAYAGLSEAAPCPTKHAQTDAEKIARMAQVWDEAHLPILPDCLAYLQTRGLSSIDIDANDSNYLGWHKSLRADDKQFAPALLARYCQPGADGRPQHVTIQRIWPSLGMKKVMPSPIKMNGIFCPIGGFPNQELGVTEGIITALSARKILAEQGTKIPVWACYSAEQLMRFVPPKSVRLLHICIDVDKSFTGQAAGYELARRLAVSHPHVHTIIERPTIFDNTDCDFNDLLTDRAHLSRLSPPVGNS